MSDLRLQVPNISCQHCVRTITRELSVVPGVRKVSVDVEAKTVEVQYEGPATEARIRDTLEEIGYPPEGA
ncbi:MAG: heavy-metal-associated domain-containing protein [Anaerolineae bacterium]|nr:heavy-metal-associated domain-containing protein [Anaerolineae bacterium]